MDKRTARSLLKKERERLEALLATEEIDQLDEATITESSGELSAMDQHPADMASDSFERAKHLSIRESLETGLTEVDRAVARLDDGSYGTCEACGTRIPDARLKVRPATRFCLEDQEAAERAGRVQAAGQTG